MGLRNLRCPGLEKTLSAFPESLPCPVCGKELEIWSDEKKAKCSTCNKTIDPRKPKNIEKNKFHVAVKELNEPGATLYYERYETIMPIASLDHGRKYKIACEACHKFGKNLACPPYSPYLLEYLGEQTFAKILCIRMPQEYFRNVGQEKNYRECFRKVRGILVDELLSYRKKGYLVAGSGCCLACDVCAAEKSSNKCLKPNKLIYSLESLGVNLTTLTQLAFEFELEWSADDYATDFICSLGAIFFNKMKR